ncbi:MAG: hypothetical protein U5N53_15650 [Mycobacterium sp.]|nr:hypothetical protein [Mycobacterium sp.]
MALLSKARPLRIKGDFRNVLPALTQSRFRLHDWPAQIHLGHPWIEALRDRA